jgi:hypothetical protein
MNITTAADAVRRGGPPKPKGTNMTNFFFGPAGHEPTDRPFRMTNQESPGIEEALSPFDEPDESLDGAGADSDSADDDSRWDVFLPDDDEIDPLPERGDFWLDDD